MLDPTNKQLADECNYTCPIEFWAAHINSDSYNEFETIWPEDPDSRKLSRTWTGLEELLIIASDILYEK